MTMNDLADEMRDCQRLGDSHAESIFIFHLTSRVLRILVMGHLKF